ncbi:MAG: hypothetical protein HY301_12280 [Verrucomicrobia bacterium]|nr:hypothetical protein [Verrucomicrobiota bacterium]
MHTQNKLRTVALFAAACSLAVATFVMAAGMSIEDVMKKYHKAPKGTDPVCKKASSGKASKQELAALLAGYQSMAAAKPPEGDAASWKAKNAALIASTQGMIDGKPEAVAKYKEAVNCKACHSVHKGK